MTTVLCIPGAASYTQLTPTVINPLLDTFLGGPQALLEQLGDTSQANAIPIVYDDWDVTFGSHSGALAINKALMALPLDEQVVVFAHSYGAVSACKWQTLYGPTSSIDPARITFVNMGNSIRPNNGAAIALYPPAGPVTSVWKTIDIAREFDKWADYPNVASSPGYLQAINNCSDGDKLPGSIHLHYEDIRLDQPHAETTIGSVRFLLYQTEPMPNGSESSRPLITTAYNRIVTPTW